MRKWLISGFVVLAVGLGGGVWDGTTAQARVKVQTTYRQKPTFLPLHSGNTYVWNAKHTKHLANLKHRQKTTLTATKRVTLTGHGTFYLVRAKHIKGYVAAKQLLAGHYYAGGYYRYPTKQIALTTERYQAKHDELTGQTVYGQMLKSQITPFAKMPKVAALKKVLNFYNHTSKTTPNLPTILGWRAHPGVRVAMEYQWTTSTKTKWQRVQVPMLEMYVGDKSGWGWSTKATYRVAKDLAAVKSRPLVSYPTVATAATTISGLYYDFPSTTANFVVGGQTIKRVYGHGYGSQHDLSLVDLNGHPRYVATAALKNIPATNPVLKRGIWQATQRMTTKLAATHLDSHKSRYYRALGSSGFTQFHYVAGTWVPQYGVYWRADAKQTTTPLRATVTVQRSEGTLMSYGAATGNAVTFRTTLSDQNMIGLTQKPVSFYQKLFK